MVLGLNINDPVPHHSTISWNRRTRFKDTTIFQDIFDEIVLQAINHDMVGGRVLLLIQLILKPMPININIREKRLNKIPRTI